MLYALAVASATATASMILYKASTTIRLYAIDLIYDICIVYMYIQANDSVSKFIQLQLAICCNNCNKPAG